MVESDLGYVSSVDEPPLKKRKQLKRKSRRRRATQPARPATTTAELEPPREAGDWVNAVYYLNWRMVEQHRPSSLPLSQISHVFYSYARVLSHLESNYSLGRKGMHLLAADTVCRVDFGGAVTLTDPYFDAMMPIDGATGCIRALTQLKKHPRGSHLKILLTVHDDGDENGAIGPPFTYIAHDLEKLQTFVETASNLVTHFELEGLDIQCERITTTEEEHDLVRLLVAIRSRLPAPHYLLTVNLPAVKDVLSKIDLAAAGRHVDYVNLCALGFTGPTIGRSWHQARLFPPWDVPEQDIYNKSPLPSAQTAVEYMVARGVPEKKIVLGLSTTGRGYPGTFGPNQLCDGGGEDIDYAALPLPGAIEQYDEDACAAFCTGSLSNYRPSSYTPWFVSYDNARSVQRKGRFVRENGLGGLFYWHGLGDKPSPHGLVQQGFVALHEQN